MKKTLYEIGQQLFAVQELPQGALARYQSDLGIKTDSEREAWWNKYEEERQKNPSIYSKEIKVDDYVTVSVWRRKDDADPSVGVCDKSPNGGSGHGQGSESLKFALSYYSVVGNDALIKQITEAYKQASR